MRKSQTRTTYKMTVPFGDLCSKLRPVVFPCPLLSWQCSTFSRETQVRYLPVMIYRYSGYRYRFCVSSLIPVMLTGVCMAHRITCLIPTCKNTCERNNTKTTFLEIFFNGYHFQACKWQVKKLPENFLAQKLRHIVSRVCYQQNINWNIHGYICIKKWLGVLVKQHLCHQIGVLKWHREGKAVKFFFFFF